MGANVSVSVDTHILTGPNTVAEKAAVVQSQVITKPTGKRGALLIGVNYGQCSPYARLNGCINDVKNMSTLLLSTGKFESKDITICSDDTPAGRASTTMAGIKASLSNLARRSRSENWELAYVHFSGHGCQTRDLNRDETDGLDECILPSDFEKSGLLTDDWLNTWAVSAMNPKTKLVVVFDSCHSGTALDLSQIPGRNVLFMSGCADIQTSAEAFNIDGKLTYSGALTSCMIDELKRNAWLWNDVSALQKAVTLNLARRNFVQKPVLSATFDLKKVSVFL